MSFSMSQPCRLHHVLIDRDSQGGTLGWYVTAFQAFLSVPFSAKFRDEPLLDSSVFCQDLILGKFPRLSLPENSAKCHPYLLLPSAALSLFDLAVGY